MPAKPPSSIPSENRQLWHAAREGMLIVMYCGGCRRRVNYWAEDLVKVLGPHHQVHIPPWPCARCGTTECMTATWDLPSAAVREGLTVRRPVEKITRWIWRDEKA